MHRRRREEIMGARCPRALFLLLLLLLLPAGCWDAGNVGLTSTEYTCGDEEKQEAEACDGDDMGGMACQDMPVPGFPGQTYYRGELGCSMDCLELLTDGCNGWCGDGTTDSPGTGGSEACDGADLGGLGCPDFSVPGVPGQQFYRGELSCQADCAAYDLSDCRGYCGDGVIDADAPGSPELCDGPAIGDAVCQDIEVGGHPGKFFYFGEPACGQNCRGWIKGSCEGYCGDSVVQTDAPGTPEVCDNLNIGDNVCSDLEVPGHPGQYFYHGVPRCTDDCDAITSEDCWGYCGNDMRDEMADGAWELCDGVDLGGAVCPDNCLAGQPICEDDCLGLDVSTNIQNGCHMCCGDDICEDGEDCHCEECYVPDADHECDGDYWVTHDSCGEETDSEYCVCGCGGSGCLPGPCCGDGICEPDSSETCVNCSEDCPTCCGDGACVGGDTCANCPGDCPGTCCGDGVCEDGAENCIDCPADCSEYGYYELTNDAGVAFDLYKFYGSYHLNCLDWYDALNGVSSVCQGSPSNGGHEYVTHLSVGESYSVNVKIGEAIGFSAYECIDDLVPGYDWFMFCFAGCYEPTQCQSNETIGEPVAEMFNYSLTCE